MLQQKRCSIQMLKKFILTFKINIETLLKKYIFFIFTKVFNNSETSCDIIILLLIFKIKII